MYNFWIDLFIVAVTFMFSFSAEDSDRVPESGPVVLASNHTSAWDPIFVGIALRKYRNRQIHYMGKAELFQNPLFRHILPQMNVFPVKRGQADRSAIKRSIEILESGNVLGIFPEGHRHYDGQIRDALPGAAYFAAKTNAVIVPAAIRIGKGIRPKALMRFGEPLHFEETAGKVTSDLLEQRTEVVMGKIKDIYDGMAGVV